MEYTVCHRNEDIPGPITRRLLEAYGEEMGLDIAEQYLSHLSEEERAALEKEPNAGQQLPILGQKRVSEE